MIAGLVWAVKLSAANGYIGQGMYRMLGSQVADSVLTFSFSGLAAGLALGLILGLARLLTGSAIRSWIVVFGSLSFYATALLGVVLYFKRHFGGFFPAAYRYHPVRLDTVLLNFFLPEGLEALRSPATALVATLALLGLLGAGFIFGLFLQRFVKTALPKMFASTGSPPSAGKPSRRLLISRLSTVSVLLLAVAVRGLLALVQPTGGPSVIWISLDTLRADHLGHYGYQRPTSPVLDELARQSVVFDRVVSPSPWTLPTHISWLTGQYPSTHGVTDMNLALPDKALTIPEVLKNNGYRTGAVVASYMLSPQYGYDQGFDTYRFRPKALAPAITETALELLDEMADGPFFLLVHYFDIHYPFEPPFPELLKFATEENARSYSGRKWPHYYDYVAETMGMDKLEFDFQLDAYDGEILLADYHVGRIIAALKEKGIWDDVILVIASDHGEEWKDHDFIGHSITLFDEVIKVPLLIKAPASAGINPGRVKQVVSTVDLAATTASFTGAAFPDTGFSRSLIPLMKGQDKDWPETAFSETELWGPKRCAVVSGDYKLIEPFEYRFGDFKRQWPRQIFNLALDPKEKRNIAGTLEGDLVQPGLLIALERFQVQANEQTGAKKLDLAPDVKKKLKALGYVE